MDKQIKLLTLINTKIFPKIRELSREIEDAKRSLLYEIAPGDQIHLKQDGGMNSEELTRWIKSQNPVMPNDPTHPTPSGLRRRRTTADVGKTPVAKGEIRGAPGSIDRSPPPSSQGPSWKYKAEPEDPGDKKQELMKEIITDQTKKANQNRQDMAADLAKHHVINDQLMEQGRIQTDHSSQLESIQHSLASVNQQLDGVHHILGELSEGMNDQRHAQDNLSETATNINEGLKSGFDKMKKQMNENNKKYNACFEGPKTSEISGRMKQGLACFKWFLEWVKIWMQYGVAVTFILLKNIPKFGFAAFAWIPCIGPILGFMVGLFIVMIEATFLWWLASHLPGGKFSITKAMAGIFFGIAQLMGLIKLFWEEWNETKDEMFETFFI